MPIPSGALATGNPRFDPASPRRNYLRKTTEPLRKVIPALSDNCHLTPQREPFCKGAPQSLFKRSRCSPSQARREFTR